MPGKTLWDKGVEGRSLKNYPAVKREQVCTKKVTVLPH
jgi:hypothetical protein